MSISSHIRVGVLRGGPSSEYDVSLKTGSHVLKHLPSHYESHDILIDKQGVWHYRGIPVSPGKILHKVDVVFNALHGAYGEDGRVQHILDMHSVPFTGSHSFSSAVGMNKMLTKERYANYGIKTPVHEIVRDTDNISDRVHAIFKTFMLPAVVKPATSGSSLGMSIAKSLPELTEAVNKAFEHGHLVLIEEYIPGREATCGVIEDFRGQPLYALLPTEIMHKEKKSSPVLFDYSSKYSETNSGVEEITPGNFSAQEKKIIEEYAKKAHETLGLRHYSRSDFIISPKRGIYVLETNSLPGLTPQSLMPKAFEAGGIPFSHFLDHVLTLALKG